MGMRLTAFDRELTLGYDKVSALVFLSVFRFVKFQPFVTKLNIYSLPHYVPNPRGLLRDSCGYSKRKLALAGKQKEPKGSKNPQL